MCSVILGVKNFDVNGIDLEFYCLWVLIYVLKVKEEIKKCLYEIDNSYKMVNLFCV